MALRHKNAVRVWRYSYSTQELAGWLREAADEIEQELVENKELGLDDLGLDECQARIDGVIERDPAVQMLAWKLYWRCGCWKLDDTRDGNVRVNAIATACLEMTNE